MKVQELVKDLGTKMTNEQAKIIIKDFIVNSGLDNESLIAKALIVAMASLEKDVGPVVHAEWINKSSSSFDGVLKKAFPLYICTNCKRYSEVNFDFCPNCGAKMKRNKPWFCTEE